jgi:hypothetical protein
VVDPTAELEGHDVCSPKLADVGTGGGDSSSTSLSYLLLSGCPETLDSSEKIKSNCPSLISWWLLDRSRLSAASFLSFFNCVSSSSLGAIVSAVKEGCYAGEDCLC